MMAAPMKHENLLLFSAKFLFFVTILVVLWWSILSAYGRLLIWVSVPILKYVFGMPIESGAIELEGILNTRSQLVFLMEGDENRSAMPIAQLVTNLPPYLALVFATSGLTWWRRTKIITYGGGILILGHFLFVILACKFSNTVQEHLELSTSIGLLLLSLPFLLWILFAYRDKMTDFFTDKADASEGSDAVEDDVAGNRNVDE